MRIGIVAPEFPPGIGGVETYSCEFARELANRGHSVFVLTRKRLERAINIPGIEVIQRLKFRRNPDNSLIQNYKPDVWHVMNAAYAWIAAHTGPVVLSVHGNDFLIPYILVGRLDLDMIWRGRLQMRRLTAFDIELGKYLTRRLVRAGIPKVHHIIANSRFTEQALLQRFPECRGKTSVGFVGVEESFFEVKRIPRSANDPVRFLTVCRLSEPRKNIDQVLIALSTLKDKYNFEYRVVGDGYMKVRLEALARQLGLAERVRFTGFVPGDELKRFFASSDLFILASTLLPGSHEGFGIVYLEANACGVPVLAAKLGGAVEAVEEGISGMFVQTPSAENISSALEHFLSGDIIFEAETCRSFAKRFTWKRVVDHMIPYYDQLTGHTY